MALWFSHEWSIAHISFSYNAYIKFHGLFPYPVKQCQLVKNFKNHINSLITGIKFHSGMNPGVNDVDQVICQAVFLFYCMANKQV